MVKTDAEKTRRTIPSIFHDPEKVAAAVAQAKRTAQEKAVPLTLSRLADCLGVEGEELYTFLEGRGAAPLYREVRRRLRLVRQGCRIGAVGSDDGQELQRTGGDSGGEAGIRAGGKAGGTGDGGFHGIRKAVGGWTKAWER